MSILIGLLPALGWGFGPIIANIFGGSALHQMLGMAYGQATVGIIIYLIFHPAMSMSVFLWSLVGGTAWSFAQLSQFQSFKLMDVSSAMPISAGLQLIETPLIGVIFWSEWSTGGEKLAGTIAIVALIIGITFMSYKDHSTASQNSKKHQAMLILLMGSVGYTACNIFSKIPNASGMESVLPQTLGRLLGATLIILGVQLKTHKSYFTQKVTLKNTLSGILAGIGTFGYLTSMSLNGVATAFPLTQLNTVVSTFGGILILHERKDKKELIMAIIGLILIVGSAFVIGRL